MDNGTVVVTDLAGRQRYEITHRAGWRETARLAASPDGTLACDRPAPGQGAEAVGRGNRRRGTGHRVRREGAPPGVRPGRGGSRLRGGDRVQIWDTCTGRLVLSARGRAAGPRDAAFSPDGTDWRWARRARCPSWTPYRRQTACGHSARQGHGGTGSDGVQPGRGTTGRAGPAAAPEHQPRRRGGGLLHRPQTAHLAPGRGARHQGPRGFQPLGDRIATSGGRRACLWDARSGALLLQVPSPATSVHDAAFSPDGTMLATADADRTVRVRELPPPHPPARPAHDR